MNVNYLRWDSEFFFKKTGSIVLSEDSVSKLSSLLENAKNQAYQLIYLFVPENISLDSMVLKQFNGQQVDKKIIFVLHFDCNNLMTENVEEYMSFKLDSELEQLAYLSGRYSRFFIDKNFRPNDFYRLYKTWIEESLKKKLADKTFIIRSSGKICSFITLKIKKSIGEIGLISVAEDQQGIGYGKNLIRACTNFLSDINIHSLSVTTQLANKSACLFYEKCGFSKISVTNIYHFWL